MCGGWYVLHPETGTVLQTCRKDEETLGEPERVNYVIREGNDDDGQPPAECPPSLQV